MESLMSWAVLGLLAALLFVGATLLFSFLLAFPIMWLWNWVVPAIFGLPQITVLEAMALNGLSSLLIRSYPSVSSKD